MTTHDLLEVAEGDTVIIKYRADAMYSPKWRGNLQEDLRKRRVGVVWVPITDPLHPILQVFVVVRSVLR